jgi:hypothetical protein
VEPDRAVAYGFAAGFLTGQGEQRNAKPAPRRLAANRRAAGVNIVVRIALVWDYFVVAPHSC